MIQRTRQLALIASACFLAVCTSAAAADKGTLVVLESAAETEQLSLNATTNQTLYLRQCDHCPMLALSVNSATRYYDEKTPITLTRAAAKPRGATVFFDKQSRIVSRIVFWR